jgi:hypothetical protein
MRLASEIDIAVDTGAASCAGAVLGAATVSPLTVRDAENDAARVQEIGMKLLPKLNATCSGYWPAPAGATNLAEYRRMTDADGNRSDPPLRVCPLREAVNDCP